METVDIFGKLTTTPKYSKKFSKLTFKFQYEAKRISQALALARPPIPIIIEFKVVVPEHLAHKMVGLNCGDTCVLVYPYTPQATAPVYPVDIRKRRHSRQDD